jgi:hypothetical protein
MALPFSFDRESDLLIIEAISALSAKTCHKKQENF